MATFLHMPGKLNGVHPPVRNRRSLRRRLLAAGVLVCCAAWPAFAEEPPANLGLEAPPGFEVTLFAGDDLAHDIYSMTLDAQGRVVVAGPNYVKTLHDDDNDGRADRATLYSKLPASGAARHVL